MPEKTLISVGPNVELSARAAQSQVTPAAEFAVSLGVDRFEVFMVSIDPVPTPAQRIQ